MGQKQSQGFLGHQGTYDTSEHKKILLIGCGDTGKSTFFRHVLHITENYTGDEAKNRDRIRSTIIDALQQMIEELLRTNSTILRDQVLNNILSVERTLVDNNSIIWKDELVDDIINSWRREDVQKIWLDRHKMSQNFPSGSLKYYMDKIETIKRSDYNPTVEDIFRCNGKTTGIVEYETYIGKTRYMIVDTGGQRNERRKWKFGYDGANCIVFTVSLIEYATLCYEDMESNRAYESLEVFHNIVNESDVPFILLFTKADELCHVTQRKSISDVFPDFSGDSKNCMDVIDFLRELFMHQYKGTDKHKIHPIVLNVIDPKMTKDALQTIVKVVNAGNSKEQVYKAWNRCDLYKKSSGIQYTRFDHWTERQINLIKKEHLARLLDVVTPWECERTDNFWDVETVLA